MLLSEMTALRLHDAPDRFRGSFHTDDIARALYSEAAGIARALPSAVAVPADARDVATLVRWARENGHALIPRGSGSSMAGGAVGPHIVVDVSRFDMIEEIDEQKHRLRAGAGAVRDVIDRAADSNGMRFPVDPSSGAFCTIGGMVATNAAGARTVRYGSTRKWIHGIECVFDDGTVAWIRRGEPPPAIPAVERLLSTINLVQVNANPASLTHAGVRKDSSGYGIAAMLFDGGHLVDLLVGSEGTLAFFTRVEVMLAPRPAATATALASFASLEHASACAVELEISGVSACEMLDRTYLDVAEKTGPTGVSNAAEAVLLIEVEGESVSHAADEIDQIRRICERGGAIETSVGISRADEVRLWQLRHAASPTLSRLPNTLQSMQFIEDGCVPPAHFASYVRGVRHALDNAGIRGVIFGHAGDAHAHVNPLVDLTDPTWRDRIRRLLDDICDLTAKLGGTLAGEHGDGRLRAPLLHRVWNAEALAAFANVKAAADPAGVFNPGCKVASADVDPLAVVRYDPSLPDLPAPVRNAVREMERARGWSRFRLQLLD